MNERDIFMAAVQREASAERRAYVAEACQGNDELRRGVEALLAAHERAGGFLFFFQAEDGIRDHCVTGVQTCALPIS